MKSRISKLLFFLFINLYLQAQSDTKTIIKEIWYDKTPVSGDIRVGIINEIDESTILPKAYYAYIDEKTIVGDSLCTVISSRDGRYKGQLSTSITKEMLGTTVAFDWKSEHSSKLKEMKKSEITMISMVAETCNSEPRYYTISQWGKADIETIYIALNSEKKPYIKIEKEGNPDIKCKCEKLEGETNVNYNYICMVPYDEYKSADRIKVIQRVVRLSRITSVNYPINLKVPDYD